MNASEAEVTVWSLALASVNVVTSYSRHGPWPGANGSNSTGLGVTAESVRP